jgi:4'-phosphopantetheinyl transferase
MQSDFTLARLRRFQRNQKLSVFNRQLSSGPSVSDGCQANLDLAETEKKLELKMNRGRPVCYYSDDDYALPEDEVHIWRTGLDITESGLTKLREVLSPEEKRRADRFHFEADRRRCVIGRGSLKLLLGQIMNLPANELQIENDEFGKPRMISRRGRCLQFNVSHSGSLVLLAITRGRKIGVDVERVRTDLDVDGIAARFFSTSEYNIWALLAGQAKYDAFFACWTRKEAYLKARGVGLSEPPDQFDVSFLPCEEPRLLETRPHPDEALRWSLRAPQPELDYTAALAVEGSSWNLKCLDFRYHRSWE